MTSAEQVLENVRAAKAMMAKIDRVVTKIEINQNGIDWLNRELAAKLEVSVPPGCNTIFGIPVVKEDLLPNRVYLVHRSDDTVELVRF